MRHRRSLAGTNGIPLERDREPVAVELAADTLGRPERSLIPVSVALEDGSSRPVDCVVAVTERGRRDLGTWCALGAAIARRRAHALARRGRLVRLQALPPARAILWADD